MTLTEYKTKTYHCFKDEDGNVHGLYQSWHRGGRPWYQVQHHYSQWHGEYKIFHEDGSLHRHVWYEHDKQVLDFLKDDKYPTSKEEIFIHKLTYQGEFISNETN